MSKFGGFSKTRNAPLGDFYIEVNAYREKGGEAQDRKN